MSRVLSLLLLLTLAPGCELVTPFDDFHTRGMDGGAIDAHVADTGTVDTGADARATDAHVVGDGGHDAATVDANRGDAWVIADGGCTVDVTSTCAGRCGQVDDPHCGVTVDCGNPCASPFSCGGDGRPTYCGCTPNATSITCAGGLCGLVTNNCGTQTDCGDPCTGSDSCGGGTQPNHCGCTPDPNACAGTCGRVSDGCRTITCGCPGGQICCAEGCISLPSCQ